MSKYNKLWEYVKSQNKEILELSFQDIKQILGFDIDHSFLKYKKELLEIGFTVDKISLKNKKVTIKKQVN